jgi:DNA-binding transcriptional LysR family regulator
MSVPQQSISCHDAQCDVDYGACRRVMDLAQLRALVAVVDHGGFTAAGDRLHLTQPAVSKQVARLEAELGVQLLRRTTRAVAPTQAGELLVRRARRALAELDAAAGELDELRGLVRGRVVVGAAPTLGPVDLAGLLQAFHRAHPDVELEVLEESSAELEALLLADALDLAFATARPGLPAALASLRIAEEDLVAVVAPGHPLARRRSVDLGALAGEPWVALNYGPGLQAALEAAEAASGRAPRIAVVSNELDRVLSLVARGIGVSVVPRTSAEAARDPVAVLAVRPAVRREVVLLWPRERRPSPAGRALLDLARDTLA